MNVPSPSKKWHLLVFIHSILTPIYLLLLVINIQFGAWIKIIASSLMNIINRFLHFWTKLSRNQGEQYPKTSNKITKEGMLEGFPILSQVTCTNMSSALKNNSSASSVLPTSFKNLSVKNINQHLSVAVTSRGLHPSTRMERRANNLNHTYKRHKESPSLNLILELSTLSIF